MNIDIGDIVYLHSMNTATCVHKYNNHCIFCIDKIPKIVKYDEIRSVLQETYYSIKGVVEECVDFVFVPHKKEIESYEWFKREGQVSLVKGDTDGKCTPWWLADANPHYAVELNGEIEEVSNDIYAGVLIFFQVTGGE